MTIWRRLSAALQEGLVLGVKWGVALLVVGFLILWALKDYGTVRQRALHGQEAFEFIQKVQAQAAQAPPPAPKMP